MRKIFLLLTVCTLCCGAFARGGGEAPQETVSFRFLAGDDVFYVRESEGMGDNGEQLQRLYSFIDEYRDLITSGTMPLYVNGYCASASSEAANLRLSRVRSNRVKTELIVNKGLTEDNFITQNHATAYTAADGTVYNDIVVVTLRIPATPVPEPAPRPEAQPEPKPEPEPTPQPEPEVTLIPQPASDHSGLYLRTNLLYDALLNPTIGLEWRIDDNIGIKLDGSWAHWGSTHGRVQKLWLLSPEVRWYILDAKRFYVGLGANFGEANIYKGIAGVLSSDTGYQGNLYGGGVTVGYNLPLNGCLSMDFNLGLGVTHFKYDTYTVSNGYRVYKGRDLSKNFWGPTQAGVSLVWRISNK